MHSVLPSQSEDPRGPPGEAEVPELLHGVAGRVHGTPEREVSVQFNQGQLETTPTRHDSMIVCEIKSAVASTEIEKGAKRAVNCFRRLTWLCPSWRPRRGRQMSWGGCSSLKEGMLQSFSVSA